VLRESRPPRRTCGSLPIASRTGLPVPLRADLLGTRAASRTASYRRRVVPGGPSPAPLHTQADVCRRTRALMLGVPSPSPSYKRPHDGQLAHAAACQPSDLCADRGAPPPVRFAVVHHLLAAPHDPYNIPVSPVFLHRPGVRRSGGRRGRAPCAPPAGRLPAPLRLSAATNQLRVSPSTFSTPPPADSPTGMAQFRRAAPPIMPRDHIASLSLIPRYFS
jgi:hypothetical protein